MDIVHGATRLDMRFATLIGFFCGFSIYGMIVGDLMHLRIYPLGFAVGAFAGIALARQGMGRLQRGRVRYVTRGVRA